jgi:hypothetical protein
MIKYLYTFRAPIRPVDSIGEGMAGAFPVWLETPTATFQQVVAGFRQQFLPCDICLWQRNSPVTIGGIETFNCGDRLFNAERTLDEADEERRLARLAGAE